MSDTEEKPKTEVVEDCSNSDVVTKYKSASEVVKVALQGVIDQTVAGKSVVEICKFGDTLIDQLSKNTFKSKKIDKGIAFPTCLSVNDVICHYSPLPSESIQLKAGDWVKIDLGCHIDGYIAVVAHTLIVGQEGEETPEPITGPAADVLMAAHQAVEVCKRLIKPGNKNNQVTEALEKIAETYGVKAVQGTVMHQMKRFVIDANKTIAQKHDPTNKVAEVEFEANEVYAIDVCFTTGLDKPVESEQRTTVFKRAVETQYRLKMKSSRYVISEVNKTCPTLPFSIRQFEDERQARMGVVECVKHGLIQAFPILKGREGDYIVHLKATILLLNSGQSIITGLDLPVDSIKSEKQVPEDITTILNEPLPVKKAKKKKKKTKKAAATAEEEE